MDRSARWSLLLMSPWLVACISVPLPSGGPKLEMITLPVTGDEASAVRATFGEPQRLDIPTNWLYEWTTERRFVVVPVMPTGMPAGAAVAGNQYRMLVEVDSSGRVGQVACTVREAPEDGTPPLACESPIGPLRSRARTLFAYRLDSKPGFEKVVFHQSEMNGAATSMVLSPDGRQLAATDAKNRLWVVDTESGEVVHRHQGEPVKFFSLAQVGPVNAVFSRDGGRLAVAQRKVGAEFLSRTPEGAFETLLELEDDDLRQIAFRGDDDTVIAFGEVGIITLQADGNRSIALEPAARLDFHVNGPERIESGAVTGDLIAVRFGQTWWTGGRTGVFTADGRGVAVLDLRNDYARVAKQGYRFSPDGVWLAHNTGRHLEVWPSAGLLDLAEGRLSTGVVEPSWVALMPFTNRKDEEEKGHMPIAFRDDGRIVAAASQVAIHVWRMDDGEPIALVGALSHQYHTPSGEYTIGEAPADSWSALQVIGLALAPDNRLTAVFADSSFNIFIGAWQIEVANRAGAGL